MLGSFFLSFFGNIFSWCPGTGQSHSWHCGLSAVPLAIGINSVCSTDKCSNYHKYFYFIIFENLKNTNLFTCAGLSCGTWSVDLHCGLCIFSCSMWHLVPWLGIEPGPPALGAQRLSYWTNRKVPWPLFQKITEWDFRLVEGWRCGFQLQCCWRWPSHLASLNPSNLNGWMRRAEL